MFVRDVGVGPPVLLLHGTPSPAEDWQHLVDVLSTTHRVLVPDMPGYGQSPMLVDGSVERVGDVLLSALHDRGIERLAAIVGYCTGGYRALELALRPALAVDLVITLGGVACFNDDRRAVLSAFASAVRTNPMFVGGEEVRDMIREMTLSAAFRQRFPVDDRRVLRWLELATGEALGVELAGLAASRDLLPELAKLKSRVYCRVGALDLAFPPACSEAIVAAVPRGELDVVPRCGHALLVEDLDATVVAVHKRIAMR